MHYGITNLKYPLIRKNLRDFISMHIIFVQFLIERVSDLTIAYLFYIISTFTKDIRKQSPIT